MARNRIDGNEHVARHCSKRLFDDDQMTIVSRAAFEPEENDPDISVNLLEYHKGSRSEQIRAVCRDIAAQREVKPIHKLAILNVGEIRNIGSQRDMTLDVVPDTLPDNFSHSLITGIALHDRRLHRQLAEAASKQIVPVVPHKKRAIR